MRKKSISADFYDSTDQGKRENQFIRLEDYEKPIDLRLASVAQVCLRTDKNSRYQSAADLCNHLEEINRQINKGTAEDTVKSFLENPDGMYREADALLSKEEPPIKEQINIDGRIVELDTQIIDVNIGDNAKGNLEKDSENLRTKRKRNIIIILLIVLVILLLAAGIIFFDNNILMFLDIWTGPGRSSVVSGSLPVLGLPITI